MSLTSILNKIFGNKSQRDLKEIQPIINKIKAIGPEVKQLDVDGLRHRIDEVRADIADAIAADQQAIDEIKTKVETLPFDERQPLWD
ncbi:MAG: hypothetical protein K2F62_04710, partial [Muribaculaceae bacterium]|nr:hypothetical protein [Muribaculaceae bacterium]